MIQSILHAHPILARLSADLCGFKKRAWLGRQVLPDDEPLERFPIRWDHLIEKESLRFNKLEHVTIEKVGQLFRNML